MERITKNCKRCGCFSDKIEITKDPIVIKTIVDSKGNITYKLNDANRHTCECPECGYMVKTYGSIEKVISLWNYINRTDKEVTQVNE